MPKPIVILAALWIVLAWQVGAQAAVVLVDDDAAPGGNGQTWATAYKYLQDALTAARNSGGTITEIWVAKGTYKPDQGLNQTPGDRTATFQLINGVALKGGYAGVGAPDPDARDISANVTVLSGDLSGNDGPNFANNGENSYHVVTGNVTGATAILDGFTIKAGNANGSGNYSGGGMYNSGGNPMLTNCTFSGNSAGYGGGMYNFFDSNPTLTNCTFSGNSASSYYYGSGGGMYNEYSSPTLTNCTFSGNSATWGGGGMYNEGFSEAMLTNCTFSGNSASSSGGGMCNSSSNPTLTNCILWGNTASTGPQGYISGGSYPSTLTVSYTDVQDGSAGIYVESGGALNWGAGNINADPRFVSVASGNLRLSKGSPCIDGGNNAAVPPDILTDLDGISRFIDDPASPDCPYAPGTCGTAPIVDMGAYEFDPAGDYDGDSVPNGQDNCPNTIPGMTVDEQGCPPVIPGDFDRDGDVDAEDMDVFAGCDTGPNVPGPPPGCTQAEFEAADIDHDSDVDQSDFGIFQRCYSGENNPADPNCAK